MSKKVNMPKLNLRKGDKVMVISGSYKGTTGEILEIYPKKNRALVEGVNVQKKHNKPTNDSPGGIVEINAPIHLSNIMLIDPKSGDKTKVGRKLVDGKLMRYAKTSGEIIG